MYICICKAVTESQLCEAVRQGLCTPGEIAACLKAGTGCGKCRGEIRQLLRRNQAESPAALALGSGEWAPCSA